jgi:type IV secretory pathway VirB2 component (pilin)
VSDQDHKNCQVQKVICFKHRDCTDSQPELITTALSALAPQRYQVPAKQAGVFLQLEQTVSFQTTYLTKPLQKLATPALAGVTALASQAAHAGPALPWDGPITTVVNNLTGPVATGISTVAFLAAGAALIFGGDDLGGIAKKLLYVVLGVALIVFGANFLSMIGLVNSGALV